MEKLDQFLKKESEKLTDWVARTLALKEAKVHASDAIVAVGQRAQVQVETSEMSDNPAPLNGSASSRSNLVSAGITEERVREIIEEMLEDYATKEWVEEKLEDYATEEWVEDQGYATEEWVEDKGYATEEWVTDQLEPYAQEDWVTEQLVGLATEAWVEGQRFVKEENIVDAWWRQMFAQDSWRDLQSNIIRSDLFDCNINNALDSLEIEANCQEGQVTVTLSHPNFVANEC